MLPDFLQQPSGDRREALQFGSDQSGRLPDLLEKDVWVVWGLQAIYGSRLGPGLTFKGGAVGGRLTLIPAGAALATLRDDFERMTDAGLLAEDAAGFHDVMTACAAIQDHANRVFSRPQT